MTLFRSRIFHAFRRFCAEKKGNVALTFAIVVIPLIGFVGAAIDFSNANAVKAEMQAALDSTALMLSKDASTMTKDQLQSAAESYFDAMFDRPEAKDVKISATYTTTGGSAVSVTGSAMVPTSFLGILGYNEIPVTDATTTKWGNSRLRVALALDNTGSMDDDGKLAALKTATNNLLTQLQDAASVDGDVYVSIVPFAKDVKIDSTNYNSSWDSWIMWDDGTDSSWDGANGTCSVGNASTRSACTAQGSCSIRGNYNEYSCESSGSCSVWGNNSKSSCESAGSCSISGNYSQSSCENDGACSTSRYSNNQNKCIRKGYTWTDGEWTPGVWTPGVWTQAIWTPDSHKTWGGCVTDRGNSAGPVSDYDRLVTAPSSSIAASQFPAEEYNACPQAMMGLNYNWSAMAATVDDMTAAGSTNQPIGLVWAWQTLAGGGPFTVPAEESGYKYNKVIILLSDGLNTQDRWYGNGYNTSTSVDHRMYDTDGDGTCANIKAAGITIYTIQVNTGGDPTSTLLQNCASSPDKFFLLTSADQIVTTFDAIGTNLTKLRLAK
jgi:Flp pilus assembly protein TadG